MSDQQVLEVFADGIVNVSHANGVFRITFGQQGPDGEACPSLKLLLPSTQIAPVIQALTSSVSDINQKIKEQTGVERQKPTVKSKPKKEK